MPIGRLVEFDRERGFGFLRREDSAGHGEDDFVHIKALHHVGIRDFEVGDVFEYANEMWNGKQRACALARIWRSSDSGAA